MKVTKNLLHFRITILLLAATISVASGPPNRTTINYCRNSSSTISVTLADNNCQQPLKVVQEPRLHSPAAFSSATVAIIDYYEATANRHNTNANDTLVRTREEVSNMTQFQSDHSPKNRSRKELHFLLARIMSLATERNVNQRCLSDIGQLTLALSEGHREVWALKGKNGSLLFFAAS